MKVLFIGGTGNISSASSRLSVQQGVDLYILNRGLRPMEIAGAKTITADIRNPAQAADALKNHEWDCVVNWIAFKPEEIERDIALFAGKTKQYIFISSSSAYQKPATSPFITESTPLVNPYWEYSRNKIRCEERLMQEYVENGFPATIVRPSLTYDTVIPVALGSWTDYTIVDRMKKGRPVIVHGDGTSLFTVTHSDDFAKGFTGLVGHQHALGQAFHITSDELLSWDQIYQAVANAAGVEANIVHIASDFIAAAARQIGMDAEGPLHGDKAPSAIFDNSKLKRFVPGFVATIPFKKGIKRTIDWYEADPARMTISDANNQLLDHVIAAYQKAFDALK